MIKKKKEEERKEISKIVNKIEKEIDKTIKELEELKENIEIFEELVEEEDKELRYRKRVPKDRTVIKQTNMGTTKANYPMTALEVKNRVNET